MSLATEKRTLLTIITEAAIESAVLRELEKHGARGYTVSDARGRGHRGIRDAAWNEAANIRIELVCSRVLAETALEHVQARFYENYAMIAFMQEIEVLRPEKF